MIKLSNVNKSFSNKEQGRLELLKGLDFSVESGDFVSIMGTSGVGKSTLLNIIGLLDSYYEGEYVFNGMDVSKQNDLKLSDLRNKYIGYVFQDYKLIEEFTVYENVIVPLLINKEINYREMDSLITTALKKAGLPENFKNKKVSKLSGGEKQRVAIARAIAKNPILLIADEPTGAIDVTTKSSIMELLKSLNNDGITIVLITHDIDVANIAKKSTR